MKKWYKTYNHEGAVPLGDLPRLDYAELYEDVRRALSGESFHCAVYFARPVDGGLLFMCLLLDDTSSAVYVATCLHASEGREIILPSLTAHCTAMHPFEREIAETHGVRFADNPWDKPLRFPHDRADRSKTIDNYPFYHIAGESLHEVNVGPIHAGIIEPGVFRFICNGEQVLHLEIVLGYQHRGVERLMRTTTNRLRQTTLAESIAGDSVIAHATAYATLVEKLMLADGHGAGVGTEGGDGAGRRVESGTGAPIPAGSGSVTKEHPTDSAPISADPTPALVSAASVLDMERALALELERIAVHLGDTGALCMDIGYQLGQVASEALRTIVINTTQLWCGNRFGKGLIRPGGSHYPLTEALQELVFQNINEVARRYGEIARNLSAVPSALARFEDCGPVTRFQTLRIGAVGPAARASGLERDIRTSHPWGAYLRDLAYEPAIQPAGDVMARLQVRMREIDRSVEVIRQLLALLSRPGCRALAERGNHAAPYPAPDYSTPLRPEALAFSLVEGWRGEICHAGITDGQGNIAHYTIVDPSVHNWMALALSVRGGGISDFPVCNKSFNLSYAGHDL